MDPRKSLVRDLIVLRPALVYPNEAEPDADAKPGLTEKTAHRLGARPVLSRRRAERGS